jgi:hypothetical protein
MRTSVSDAAYPVVSLTAQPVSYREMRREKASWTTLMWLVLASWKLSSVSASGGPEGKQLADLGDFGAVCVYTTVLAMLRNIYFQSMSLVQARFVKPS